MVPDGRLVIYSADKGEKLHEINTGLRVGMGPPITYMVDGKQYVTVIGGRGVVVPPPAGAGAGAAAATGGAGAGQVTAAGGGAATGRGGGPAPDSGPPSPPKILTYALDAR